MQNAEEKKKNPALDYVELMTAVEKRWEFLKNKHQWDDDCEIYTGEDEEWETDQSEEKQEEGAYCYVM